jgi:hypothetical protein
MPREKKYTRTVAVRLTEEEWELVQLAIRSDRLKNPTEYIRQELVHRFAILRVYKASEEKKAASKAKREAKKAANANA